MSWYGEAVSGQIANVVAYLSPDSLPTHSFVLILL